VIIRIHKVTLFIVVVLLVTLGLIVLFLASTAGLISAWTFAVGALILLAVLLLSLLIGLS
jgi:hypothetical protein